MGVDLAGDRQKFGRGGIVLPDLIALPDLLGADAEQHQYRRQQQQRTVAAQQFRRLLGAKIVGNLVKNINQATQPYFSPDFRDVSL